MGKEEGVSCGGRDWPELLPKQPAVQVIACMLVSNQACMGYLPSNLSKCRSGLISGVQ